MCRSLMTESIENLGYIIEICLDEQSLMSDMLPYIEDLAYVTPNSVMY